MSMLPLVDDRAWKRIKKTETCWLWTGSTDRKGYGQIRRGPRPGRLVYVHRAVYEELVGPIPDGLVIDHLCRVPACCNPSHLEPVTQRENMMRGVRWQGHVKVGRDRERKREYDRQRYLALGPRRSR